VLQTAVYSGEYGTRSTAAHVSVPAGNRVQFETTTPLQPRQGLTIAVGWPKWEKPLISLRLPPSVVVHTDRYDDSDLEKEVDAYDRRRHEHRPITAEKQRHVAKYGALDYCPWSENVTRQLSLPERAGFRPFLKLHGMEID